MIDALRKARSPEELEQALAAARPGASPSLARMLDEIAVRNQIVGLVQRASAEEEIVRHLVGQLDAALARLAEGWAAQAWSPWVAPDRPPAPRPELPSDPGDDADREELRSIQLTDEGTLLFDMASRFVERRLDGSRVREWPAHGCILVGCDRGLALARGWMPSGETVNVRQAAIEATRNAYQAVGMPTDGVEEMFADEPEEGESLDETLFALELATGRWCAPPASAAWAEEEPFTELPRLRRADGATALLLCDRGWAVQSRDLQLVWAEERVLETGALAEVARVAPAGGRARAVGRAPDGAIVCRDAEADHACLDAGARLFASVAEDTVQVVRTDDGRRVAAFRL